MSILNPHAPVFIPAVDRVHIEVEKVDSQEESLGLDRKMFVTEATDRTNYSYDRYSLSYM